MEAAREFFSTFKFKATTDPDANSISFRLFTIEHTMSVREWSLRMGLFTKQRMTKEFGMTEYTAHQETPMDSHHKLPGNT